MCKIKLYEQYVVSIKVKVCQHYINVQSVQNKIINYTENYINC